MKNVLMRQRVEWILSAAYTEGITHHVPERIRDATSRQGSLCYSHECRVPQASPAVAAVPSAVERNCLPRGLHLGAATISGYRHSVGLVGRVDARRAVFCGPQNSWLPLSAATGVCHLRPGICEDVGPLD